VNPGDTPRPHGRGIDVTRRRKNVTGTFHPPWSHAMLSFTEYPAQFTKPKRGQFNAMPLVERMEAQTEKSAGCWLWTGARNRQGYGHVGDHYHTRFAHRVAYELARGPIPDGLMICHRCDNPRCVNPAHLYAGTAVDNARDAVDRGRMRSARGEEHYSARLSEQQVTEILRSVESGKDLAARLGVAKSTISMIRTGRNWKHLRSEPSATQGPQCSR
jgi:hypothetical protein